MVTLAILVLAAAFVVPSINSYFVTLRLKTAARGMFADLNKAKISAMKTLRPHTVLLGGPTGSRQGWIVFGDSDDDGVFDSGEKEIGDVTLEGGITFPAQALGTAITFDRNGLVNRGAGTYTLESVSHSKQIVLRVSPAGFIDIQ